VDMQDFEQKMAGRTPLDMKILGMDNPFIKYQYMNVCMYICPYIHIHIHICIYICIYDRQYSHIHVYRNRNTYVIIHR